MLQEFPLPGTAVVDHVHRDVLHTEYPAELHDIISPEMMIEARDEIRQWAGYEATPLHALSPLARELNLDEILYKDEGQRFGLGSFKALGGAYAVLKVLQSELQASTGRKVDLGDIRKGKHTDAVSRITVASATAGNHGRSLAWGARQAGCPCKIFIHAGVGDARKQVMESFGAEVIRVDGNYDDSVRVAAKTAEQNGWLIVSDTSYPGYTECPRHIKAGYTLIGDELLEQLAGRPRPTHIFLQTGCGGLAAGAGAGLWEALGADLPRVVVVEPDRAPCLLISARAGEPTNYQITEESLMVGLSCGDVSLLAWDIVSRCASDYLSLTDNSIPPVMRLLATGKAGGGRIIVGESGAAGLAALIDVARNPDMRDKLGLGPTSRVMLIGSEGATSPDIYDKIVGQGQ